jgi:hypothetical protein
MGTPTRRAVLKGTAAVAGLAGVAQATPAGTSSGHPHQVARLILTAARVGARG